MLFALLAAAALADDLVSREIDPRFLPQQATASVPQSTLQPRDPITHPF